MTSSSAVFRFHASSMARTLVQSTLDLFEPLSAASIRELCVQGCCTLEYPDPEAQKLLLGLMASLDALWLVKSDCEPFLRILETDSESLPRMRSLCIYSDPSPSLRAVRAMAQARHDKGRPIEHPLVACRPEDVESWNGLAGTIGAVDVVVRPRDFPSVSFMTARCNIVISTVGLITIFVRLVLRTAQLSSDPRFSHPGSETGVPVVQISRLEACRRPPPTGQCFVGFGVQNNGGQCKT
jgi:hypothetical protein